MLFDVGIGWEEINLRVGQNNKQYDANLYSEILFKFWRINKIIRFGWAKGLKYACSMSRVIYYQILHSYAKASFFCLWFCSCSVCHSLTSHSIVTTYTNIWKFFTWMEKSSFFAWFILWWHRAPWWQGQPLIPSFWNILRRRVFLWWLWELLVSQLCWQCSPPTYAGGSRHTGRWK